MRVPNSVVLPVGTHIDSCCEREVEEKKEDIMHRLQAMLEERKTKLAHFIANLESNEESEFYVDQWNRLKEMENCSLKVRSYGDVLCTFMVSEMSRSIPKFYFLCSLLLCFNVALQKEKKLKQSCYALSKGLNNPNYIKRASLV